MGDLDTAVERTLAAGTRRLRLFRAHDPPFTWRDAGHGSADFRRRRTHIVFRPIPPDALTVGLPPDTEVECLFDGGRHWFKGLDANRWGHPLGKADDPRQAGDPTWILDALLGAATLSDQHDAANGPECRWT